MLKMHTAGQSILYYKEHTECLHIHALAINLLLNSLNYEWVDNNDCFRTAITICGIFDIDEDKIVYYRSKLVC